MENMDMVIVGVLVILVATVLLRIVKRFLRRTVGMALAYAIWSIVTGCSLSGILKAFKWGV